MTELLMEYGLFLAKAITIVIAFGIIFGLIVSSTRRTRPSEELKIRKLNDRYLAMTRSLNKKILSRGEYRKEERARKKLEKQQKKDRRKKTFVINFRGDIKASAVAALREEVSAILTVAAPDDEVLVRLENAGGLVHDHGLAASQLQRFRQKKIPLTIAVDKVAASGGYMMACVADRILAAPFAVIGSVGVLAQLPNFHRLLDRHGVDFEQVKAGEYKRTVTIFGKNTKKDRKKLQQELEDIHQLFKHHIQQHRPIVDVEQVATGEHWLGSRALELKLVDELQTSDEYLLASHPGRDLYEVSYLPKKELTDKIVSAVQAVQERLLTQLSGVASGRRWLQS
jgi:serine protease SohB